MALTNVKRIPKQVKQSIWTVRCPCPFVGKGKLPSEAKEKLKQKPHWKIDCPYRYIEL